MNIVIYVSFLGLQRKLMQRDRIEVLLSNKIRIVDDLLGYVKEIRES